MGRIILAAVPSCWAVNTFAASCKDQAAEKKLAGAALTSFIGKCKRDAPASCDATAAERKLTGAASFTTKCVNDAVGPR